MAILYNKIFNLPERCLVNKKITKAFFLKNFELTSAEKKLLNLVQNMEWLGSIKPIAANIPAVRNDNYTYEEIQIITCTAPSNQLAEMADKFITLLQKYIPYQMVVVIDDDNDFVINACDKRINLNDSYKRTIEKYISTPIISKLYKTEITDAFFKALDFVSLDKSTLETTYKSYIQAIVQLQISSVTGTFNKKARSRTEQDMELLANIDAIEKEVIRLSSQIKKETQLNKKVSLNIEIQKHRNQISSLKKQLSSDGY